MSPESAAVSILVLGFLLIVLVDRGVPNTLESLAFAIEKTSRFVVAALRRSATRLRERQRRIELANRERLARQNGSYEASEVTANSSSFSATA